MTVVVTIPTEQFLKLDETALPAAIKAQIDNKAAVTDVLDNHDGSVTIRLWA